MTFKAGDKCIVTGDTQRWNHGFHLGTKVELLEPFLPNKRNGWKCSAVGYSATWNVATEDLIPDYDPVTDQELDEVRKSLGLT